MAYHINKKGTLSKCFAIFRPCPLAPEHHFATIEEGEEYLREWEQNKIKNESLLDEEILDPKNKGVMRIDNIHNKEIVFERENGDRVKYSDLPKDSIILLNSATNNQSGLSKTVSEDMKNGKIARKYVGRSVDEIEDKAMTFHFESAYKLNSISKFYDKRGRYDEIFGSSVDFINENVYNKLREKVGDDEALYLLGYKKEEVKIDNSKLSVIYRIENKIGG